MSVHECLYRLFHEQIIHENSLVLVDDNTMKYS